MEFSRELKEKLKTYFLNKYGIVLSDDKANSYLYTLGSLGLIIAGNSKCKESDPHSSSDSFAHLRRPPLGEHRKARESKNKGTDLVTQCPQNASISKKKQLKSRK